MKSNKGKSQIDLSLSWKRKPVSWASGSEVQVMARLSRYFWWVLTKVDLNSRDMTG